MKTKIITKIDGYDIIIGVSNAPIDPVSTQNNAAKLLTSCDSYKNAENKKAEYCAANEERIAALMAHGKAKTKSEQTLQIAAYQSAVAKMESIQSDLAEIDKAMKSDFKTIITDNPVYAIPAPGETIIEDTEAEAILSALATAQTNGTQLSSDMTEICDYRGAVVWTKSESQWTFRRIVTLGDKPAKKEYFESELTETQIAEIKAQFAA